MVKYEYAKELLPWYYSLRPSRMKHVTITLLLLFIGLFLIQEKEPVVFIREAEAMTTVATTTAQVVQIEVMINWTPERIKEEIRNTFPEDPETAVAIAMAESKLKPHAYNPEVHQNCNGSIGIMQIACVHHRVDPERLKDVAFNIKKAREIYLAQGWGPWGAYTNGSYKQYLSK